MDQYVFEAVLESIRSKSYQSSEGKSEFYQTPKDRASVRTVKSKKPFTILAKISIPDVWQDPE